MKSRAPLHVLGFLKTFVPAFIMLSMAPQTLLLWVGWRLVSFFTPEWIYQQGEDAIFGLYQRMVLFFFEHLVGVEIILYGDAEEALKKQERVLYLSNHQSDFDWIIVHMLAIRQGMLHNVRYVLKDTLQMVPLYGYYLYMHGCIYVKRGNFSPGKMMRALRYLQNPKIKTWMVVFPEGTRFNPELKEQIEKSQKYATDQGLQPLNNLLTPKGKGMELSLDKLRNYFDAVYDVTVIYEGTKDSVTGQRLPTPSMFELLRSPRSRLHIHLKRITIEMVPTDKDELRKWLHDLYTQKDTLLDSYYNENGNLAALSEGKMSPLSRWSTAPAFLFHAALLLPLLTLSAGRQVFWKTLLLGTLGGYGWLMLRSVA